MKSFLHVLAFSSAKSTLTSFIASRSLHFHFKVGKTTQGLKKRFEQNYSDDYEDIELLYDSGSNGALIDWLEVEMIKYCRETYGDNICDNRQEGGGPDCKDNADEDNTAKLYVVWRR